MKVVTLLCGLFLITTGTWAYSRDCAKGPEYWCRDASTAKDCGAVSHCEQTVWHENESKQKTMKTHETAQMLCNVLVQASTELLARKSVDTDAIKQYLRADCSNLPAKNNVVQQCEMAVDLYLSDILRHIQSGTEGTKICSIIQGHDTPNAVVSKSKPVGITPNQTCVLCEFVVHLLQTFASANSTAQELSQLLEKVCQVMPSVLRAECKSFIDLYGDDIVAILAREFDPAKTCTLIKLCPKSQNVAFLTKPNAHTCGLCDYVSTYLSAGYTREKACAHFSTDGNIKQECETLVHLYKADFCSQLPLCTDDVEIQPVEQSIATEVNSLECSLCKYVVGYIDAIIQNNKSEAAIEAALEKVCTILPAALNGSCYQFIESYGPILVQLIEKFGTPDQVCVALKVCQKETQKRTARDLKSAMKVQKTPVNSWECSLCKYVVSYVDAVVQTNKTEAAIEAALEKVCSILPVALNASCVQFVEAYGPILVQLIEKYGTPSQVCNALKLCQNGTQEMKSLDLKSAMKVQKTSVNALECSLCKYVVGYIDAVIQNNKSEAAIEAALEKVCTILPAALNGSCYQFIESYGPILVQLIEKFGTPDQVCVALKVCQKDTQKVALLSRKVAKSIRRAKDGTECTLCKYILSYINLLIENNSTAQDFEKALEVVCSILPSEYHKKCSEFVQAYGSVLVELIAELDDPNVICQWLSLCSKSSDEFIQIPALKTNKLRSLPCNLCQYVVNYLDAIVQSNSTETEFEDALDKACKILPGSSLQSECQSLVHLYGANLIKLLVEYGDPKAVCQVIGICDK